jgi:Pyruvate/2-oxoacid:ferredoxin oxidoreductase gamma subunit
LLGGSTLFEGKPIVDEAALFGEIAFDFRDPLDAVREAISNAFDANTTEIHVSANMGTYRGDEELILEFKDTGEGMALSSAEDSRTPSVSSFFSLGSSSRRDNPEKIGQKGHGTKTYFNSRYIEVTTCRNGQEIFAIMDEPKVHLSKQEVPPYLYETKACDESRKGTQITIYGYNRNRTNGFDQDQLQDFIFWFTKFGSIELKLDINKNKDVKLYLKGVDKDEPEILNFGHRFPPKEEFDFRKLKGRDPASPTKYFVKKWSERGVSVKDNPHVKIDLLFYIEGDRAKTYNKMLRRPGRAPKEGMYTVEQRYGLWVCKDYIPIQHVTEWISKGQRGVATKYHAFVNCQKIKLTANRGDIGNTDSDLLKAIEQTVTEWHEQKVRKDAVYKKYEEELESEEVYRDPEQERKELETRKKNAKNKKVHTYDKKAQGKVVLIEPRQEAGVLALFCTISSRIPQLFSFKIVDYDTRKGYDALVVSTNPTTRNEEYKFVEFKKALETSFNHTFRNLAHIVCWECSLGDGMEISDINGEKRTLKITKSQEYTKYVLRSDTEEHNIEVYVLKDYLKEKCGIEFRPRVQA